MNNLSKIAGVAIVLAFLSASPVIAKNPDNQGKGEGQGSSQGNSQNKGNSQGKGNSQNASSKNKDDRHEMHYAGINQQDARKWAKQYNIGGYKPLPPGIRKNLARGKPIPPGIAKTRLPQGYINQLPRYEGYEWRGYGTDLVLVDLVSNVIADVIMDVLN
jgi:hypothetical protein